jgi:hypothetical protein
MPSVTFWKFSMGAGPRAEAGAPDGADADVDDGVPAVAVVDEPGCVDPCSFGESVEDDSALGLGQV